MENQDLSPQAEERLTINGATAKFLNEIRKWASFLSIVGFVSIGLMLLFSVLIGVIFSFLPVEGSAMPFPSYLLSIFYIVLATIYFYPVYYLYKFSVRMKHAIYERSNEYLESSFGYLKSHYKFMGILTIVMIALYPLMIIFGIVFGIMGSMH